ncbi:MAG: DUF6618 family protein [Eubacteriales bacterium]
MEYDCVNTRARKEENKHWKGHILSYVKRKDGFEAEISGRGSSFHLIVGETRHGNYLCIPTWEVGSELADYNDTFWNQEQIGRQLSAVDSITLANGIKAIGILLK